MKATLFNFIAIIAKIIIKQKHGENQAMALTSFNSSKTYSLVSSKLASKNPDNPYTSLDSDIYANSFIRQDGTDLPILSH